MHQVLFVLESNADVHARDLSGFQISTTDFDDCEQKLQNEPVSCVIVEARDVNQLEATLKRIHLLSGPNAIAIVVAVNPSLGVSLSAGLGFDGVIDLSWSDELITRCLETAILQVQTGRNMVEIQRNVLQAIKSDLTGLQELTIRDDLTKLYNLRYFREVLDKEFARCSRHNHPFTILFIDMDNLKEVNLNYGHPGGGSALSQVGELILSRVRRSDYAFRIGGDEFVILNVESDTQKSLIFAQYLLNLLRSHDFQIGSDVVHLTASAGLAAYPKDGLTTDEVLQRADDALYQAKEKGKDQVVCYNMLRSSDQNITQNEPVKEGHRLLLMFDEGFATDLNQRLQNDGYTVCRMDLDHPENMPTDFVTDCILLDADSDRQKTENVLRYQKNAKVEIPVLLVSDLAKENPKPVYAEYGVDTWLDIHALPTMMKKLIDTTMNQKRANKHETPGFDYKALVNRHQRKPKKANGDVSLQLALLPQWPTIEAARVFVREWTYANYADNLLCETFGMVTAELLENAMRHADLQVEPGVKFYLETVGKTLSIAVESGSGINSENVTNLRARLEWIRGFSDPQQAYLEAIQEVARKKDTQGGLGLVRIAFEGGCQLSVKEIPGDMIRVTATWQLA